ncbi:hypothetical protein BDN72DRAFT_895740 [Pluteus cervinus]|uniref:Uncharacterized protein n=1 Tax=Pluteus cervinus TaxID=181527 RepID=A0ACD3B079_9AGAR|nr:hypothetical protein BDN72DRAFT_895740 [Pluteus cervinus]
MREGRELHRRTKADPDLNPNLKFSPTACRFCTTQPTSSTRPSSSMFWRTLARHSISPISQCGLNHPTRTFVRSSPWSRLTRELTPHRFARSSSGTGKVPSSIHEQVAQQGNRLFSQVVEKPRIRNQILFFTFGSLFVFTYAASRTNFETEAWTRRLLNTSQVWSPSSITSVDLKRAQHAELIKSLREGFAAITGKAQEVPGLIRPWLSTLYVAVMQPYADASEGKRLTWKICLLNAAIFVAWKFRRLQGPMTVRFMHNPLSGLSYTLLTSVFSHRSFLHLAFNCLALESFGSAAYYYFVKEQANSSPPQLESTATWHFLAFFLSAGLFSGLVSHVVAAKFHYPRMIAELAKSGSIKRTTDTWASAVAASVNTAKEAAKAAPTTILPSLGASGAVYAAVTVTALAFPESQVALFIPPSFPIPIQWGVGGMITMDLIGIMRGWRMFDHWAHLGGAAFGIAYYNYGPAFWHRMRQGTLLEPEPEPELPSPS